MKNLIVGRKFMTKQDFPKGGILGKERNLLTLYMYATGRSEIPDSYHLWSLLALVAASVGKRAHYAKFSHSLLYPNLYVFLIGPSALGKGAAMSFMLQMEHLRHNVLNGAATHKALVTRFSTQAPTDHPGYEQCFLLHEELGNSVPSGPLGKAFVKFITDTHSRAGESYVDATRRDGEVRFDKPCITWLAGSTPEWLGESITLEDMLSGFFGRVIGVPEWYNNDFRVYRPAEHDPTDKQEVVDYLCGRIDLLTRIPAGTEFEMSKQAEEIDREWYLTRQEPQDERMMPFWKRESDLSLKLAMVLSLCRGQSMVIEAEDITGAHDLVRQAREAMPKIIAWATESTMTAKERELETFLKVRKGFVRRSRMLQHMKQHGMGLKELEDICDEMEAAGKLLSRRNGNTKEYKWVDTGRYIDLSLQRAAAG